MARRGRWLQEEAALWRQEEEGPLPSPLGEDDSLFQREFI